MFRLSLPVIAVTLAILPAPAVDPKPIEPFDGKGFKGWKFRDEKNSKWQIGVAAVTEKNELSARRET
jgi:hypothetical protein